MLLGFLSLSAVWHTGRSLIFHSTGYSYPGISEIFGSFLWFILYVVCQKQ